ncbi:tyrosine-type recombinase/integrase [Plantibacter sp. CFBP 8804]|uniref:tyrosine-type recombinase/integrase n=1 Tax=Plantibacter sp. CFBP 8804 TaxID=2775270 RepID=UPI001785C8E1|nr:tyrosine-type recombinase/integrase [Plantibacter sp. CFBP 8804]MBD8517079.1 tyrosine-type recombinase/integrase [Plantibacter sp. CFBP 8804]
MTAETLAELGPEQAADRCRKIEDTCQLYHAHCIAASRATSRTGEPSTASADVRVKYLRRYLLQLPVDPYDSEPAHFAAYAETMHARVAAGEITANTDRTQLSAIRGWGAWAKRTRKVDENPTETPSGRLRKLPTTPQAEKLGKRYRKDMRAAGISDSTIDIREGVVFRRFARGNPNLDLTSMTVDDITSWIAPQAPHWSPEYQRLNYDAFQSVCGWMKRAGLSRKNPAKKLRAPRGGVQTRMPCSDEALASAMAKADPDERLMLQLAAELGLRRAEVAVIHVADVIGKEDDWALRVHGKGRKIRVLPLPFSLATALRSRGPGYVFPGQCNGHVSPQHLGKKIANLLPPKVSMHSLRHRFATRAYAINKDTFAVQQLLGHASAATTQRYVHSTSAELRYLVEAVAA